MATEHIFLTGKIKWCKHDYLDKYGKYTADFYPDEDSLDIFRASGSQWQIRKDNDGETYIKISRLKEGERFGEPHDFGPPAIRINLGTETVPGVPDTEPFSGKVGNGSDVTVKIEVYDAGNKKGSRWEGIRVDKLIPYEGKPREPKAITPDYPF